MIDFSPTPEINALGIKTGRHGWPRFVQYRTRDGHLHMCPPRDEPWTEVVHKKVERDAQAASGDLYSTSHTGNPAIGEDHRSAPMA